MYGVRCTMYAIMHQHSIKAVVHRTPYIVHNINIVHPSK